MDKISKEHVIAGVIGGFTSLVLAFALRKAMHGRKRGNFRKNV